MWCHVQCQRRIHKGRLCALKRCGLEGHLAALFDLRRFMIEGNNLWRRYDLREPQRFPGRQTQVEGAGAPQEFADRQTNSTGWNVRTGRRSGQVHQEVG